MCLFWCLDHKLHRRPFASSNKQAPAPAGNRALMIRMMFTHCRRSTVRFSKILMAAFLSSLVVLASPVSSPAQDSGLAKLLEIFEAKGVLTAEEVNLIRQAAARDRQQFKENKQADDRRLQEPAKRENKAALEKRELSGAPAAGSSGDTPASPQTASRSAGSSEPQEAASPLGRLNAGYNHGFCLQTDDPKELALCLGALLQTDYRYYEYDNGDPDNNRFDIRRARLKLSGNLFRYLGYKFEYEFQGTSSRNLLDAYADIHALPGASIRLGQFKEPFGLEQSSPVKNYFFTEPSFGYYLTPGRDVGGMVHGSLLDDRLNYGIGAFNGDGLDDSVGADSDYPQVTGRLVLAPFRNRQTAAVENLQFGGSFSYGKIDRNNVDVQVDTAGLTTFFDISPGSKFAVIQHADQAYRFGAELAWAWGPVALMSEYTGIRYEDVETSSTNKPARSFPYGTTKFKITGLNHRETVTVTLVFPDNVPTTARYYKVSAASGWQEIPFGSNDGDETITISLTDGDPLTDADGRVNGEIDDPGALTTAASSGSGGGGGACFIDNAAASHGSAAAAWLILLLVAGAVFGIYIRLRD